MRRHTVLLTITMVIISCTAKAASISWGTASSFAVLAGTTVTSTGETVVDGDLGVSPGTAVTGFNPPGIVTGTIHANDEVASQALSDAAFVYTTLAMLAVDTNLTGTDLGSLTLPPGVYEFDSSAQLTGDLVLDGDGEYIFLIGSTLTTAPGSSVQTINGANWENVFFQVGSSATIDADTLFLGNIIALESVTLVTGSSVDGRVVGINGAVTMDSNYIIIPEPTTAALLAAGLFVVFARRRRIRRLEH